MAESLLSSLARRIYDARDTAEDYGRDAGRRLSDTGSDARGELRRLWSQMEDLVERNFGGSSSSARDAVRAATGTVREYAEDGREMAYDVADQIRSATRERPLVAIGIAIAATLVITSLLSASAKRR